MQISRLPRTTFAIFVSSCLQRPGRWSMLIRKTGKFHLLQFLSADAQSTHGACSIIITFLCLHAGFNLQRETIKQMPIPIRELLVSVMLLFFPSGTPERLSNNKTSLLNLITVCRCNETSHYSRLVHRKWQVLLDGCVQNITSPSMHLYESTREPCLWVAKEKARTVKHTQAHAQIQLRVTPTVWCWDSRR